MTFLRSTLSRSLLLLALSVPAIAAEVPAPPSSAPAFAAPDDPIAIAHSHNDFEQRRPLQDALANGFHSAEVDVTDRWGEVRVTHLGFITVGSLKEMYLDPLQKIVDRRGTVGGDGKRFYLWIEVRPFVSRAEVAPMLQELLEKYPMLARYDVDGRVVRPGPVVAIIMGYSPYAQKYFEGKKETPACFGVHTLDAASIAADPWTARRSCWAYFKWDHYVRWDGHGEFPESERRKLAAVQARAHALGLRTRFWKNPETKEFWDEMRKLPMDLLSTDALADAKETLEKDMPDPAETERRLAGAHGVSAGAAARASASVGTTSR